MTIADWRAQIDDVDNELLRLLNHRAQLASHIGRLKLDTNLPLNDDSREHYLLSRLRTVNAGPLDDDAVTVMFQQIISETRRLESRVLLTHDSTDELACDPHERELTDHLPEKGELLT